jgi:hypothetical protein
LDHHRLPSAIARQSGAAWLSAIYNWQGFLRDLTEAEDHFLTSSGENLASRRGRSGVMEPGKWALEEALAAIESETRHLVHAEAPSTPTAETDVEIAPLVQKVGATSIAEIEKLIAELQEAKDLLQSEGERVRREAANYTNLAQMALASVKIISDTVARWREAGHPLPNQPRSGEFEVTPSSAEDLTGSVGVPDQQLPQSQGQIRPRTRGK